MKSLLLRTLQTTGLCFALGGILVPLANCTTAPEDDGVSSEVNHSALSANVYNFGTISAPGKCIDVAGASNANGANIHQWQCLGNGAQAWRVEDAGESTVRLVNAPTGKCLDVAGNGKAAGTNVQLWECNGSDAQRWWVEQKGEDVTFVGKGATKCLDVSGNRADNGTNIQIWDCNGGTAQRFRPAVISGWGGGGSQPPPAPTPPPPSGGDGNWRLVWQDEFDGNNLDGGKWSNEVWNPGTVNNELQRYTPGSQNVWVGGGHLTIRAHHTAGGEFTSGRIKTQGKASWLYGKMEARIQLPTIQGGWPAFWMMPENQSRGWPACGEIDIMEEVCNRRNFVHATTHSRNQNGANGQQVGADTYVDSAEGQYHTYAVEWEPGQIRGYVDGRQYYTHNNNGGGDDVWPFNKNFHIILNYAVGGAWGGQGGVDYGTWDRDMLVDYVRVYQR